MAAGVETELLLTKITVPGQYAEIVNRARLVARLNDDVRCKLVTMVAPAGYGKTTLLQEWVKDVAAASHRIAWVSLDSGDDNPERFWSYVNAAIMRACPGLEGLPDALKSFDGAIGTVSLNPLINAISALEQPLWLILDDYHEITQKAIHDGVAYMVEHAPECLHVVLASRNPVPLPLARMRARRQLAEFKTGDLAFTAAEAKEFFVRVMRLDVSESQAASLASTTEGWPAGLQFVALAMQDGIDCSLFKDESFAANQELLEYLTEEILERLSEELRVFLRESSVLGVFSADLCNAALGRNDSLAMIRQIESLHLFIGNVGDGGIWYRYHALFGDTLRAAFEADDPARAARVHGDACVWLHANGYDGHAIPHALAARNYEQAAAILCEYGMKAVSDFHVTELVRWSDELPPEVFDANPRLGICYALACFELGEFSLIEPKLHRMETVLQSAEEAGAPFDDAAAILSEASAIRAAVACVADEYRAAIALAQSVIEGPAANDSIVVGVNRDLAYAYETAGNLEAAAFALERVSDQSLELGANVHYVRAMCDLARIRKVQGLLEEAENVYSLTLEHARRQGMGKEWLVCAQIGLASLLVERGDLDAATTWVEDATNYLLRKDSFEATSWVHVIPLYCCAIDCQLAFGNVEQTTQLAEKLESHLRQCKRLSIQPFGEAVDVLMRVWIGAGELDKAARFSRDARQCVFAPGALKMAGRIALARFDVAVGEYGDALDMLGALEERLRDASAVKLLIEELCLKAVALNARGESQSCSRALQEALSLGHNSGFLCLFATQGTQLCTLVEQFDLPVKNDAGTANLRRYLRSVQRTIGHAAQVSDEALEEQSDRPLSQPEFSEVCDSIAKKYSLSARQKEVFAMLAKGRNTRFIQDALYISAHTAKSHILNIYRKLGIHSQQKLISIVESYHDSLVEELRHASASNEPRP